MSLSVYGQCSIMTKIDNILARIAEILDGRTLLSLREQLLVDCADEIIRLRKSKLEAIDKAAEIVETTISNEKKSAIIKAIKELKTID